MLQPHKYPEMVGQALVLEPEPFVQMVDDDNPWVEGLFLTVTVGLVVGVAQLIGGLLLTASLPDPASVLEALLQAWRQMLPSGLDAAEIARMEAGLRQSWWLWTGLAGYSGGWLRLLVLVLTPLIWIAQWLVYGLLGHAAARLLGGQGSLNQTLGATALTVAPRVLLALTLVPFVSVPASLMLAWGLLIVYRGLQVAHELSWERAALAALVPLFVLLLLSMGVGMAVATLISLVGGPL